VFRRTPSEPPPADPAHPATGRRFTDAHAPSDTAIGPGVRVNGALRGGGSVEVAGSFEGPIEIDGLLHVLESGRVVGSVTAAGAVIEGALEGRLAVSGRLELSSTARVRADIEAPTVAIAEGSVFDGRVNMGGLAEEPEGAARTAPVPGAAPQSMTFREKRKHRRHRHQQQYAPPPEAEATAAPSPAPAPAAPEPAPAPAAEPAPPDGKPPANA
jgi:cytoskeletal protein CcmA (bactofilin family)